MRRAALHDAQIVILNETAVRLASKAFEQFITAIEAPVAAMPFNMLERLSRKAVWDDPSKR